MGGQPANVHSQSTFITAFLCYFFFHRLINAFGVFILRTNVSASNLWKAPCHADYTALPLAFYYNQPHLQEIFNSNLHIRLVPTFSFIKYCSNRVVSSLFNVSLLFYKYKRNVTPEPTLILKRTRHHIDLLSSEVSKKKFKKLLTIFLNLENQVAFNKCKLFLKEEFP